MANLFNSTRIKCACGNDQFRKDSVIFIDKDNGPRESYDVTSKEIVICRRCSTELKMSEVLKAAVFNSFK